MHKKPILIFGLPRSGTSWLAETLAAGEGSQLLIEPDNEGTNFLGYFYKRGLGRFPYFRENEHHAAYLKMFERALLGTYIFDISWQNNLLFKSNLISLNLVRRRLFQAKPTRRWAVNWDRFLKKDIYPNPQKRRIVKSVHAVLNIPFLRKNLDFEPLVILRHPAAVVASHQKLNLSDLDQHLHQNKKLVEDFLKPHLASIKKLDHELSWKGLQVGIVHHIFTKHLEKEKFKYVKFEYLCENPIQNFQTIYKDLELNWSEKVEEYIKKNNVPGQGFETKRIASKQSNSWQKKWTSEELHLIQKGYNILPNMFYDLPSQTSNS